MAEMTRDVLKITIPDAIPPSVNHYKKPITLHTANGPRLGFGLTAEAETWQMLTQIYARGRTLVPEGIKPAERNQLRYTLHARVILGPKQRGDGDNFLKCLADALCKAGVIHSDARVQRWYLEVEDDMRETGPRTEIRVALMRKAAKCPKKPKPAKA